MKVEAKAKESKHVEKVREKLKKRLDEEHSHINNESLREMRYLNNEWINRHEPERVNLKDKTFKRFDENRHPMEPRSHYVLDLLRSIQEEASEGERRLRGRIKLPPVA